MRQRLSKLLTYYLEANAVTEDHIREVTKLQKLYGMDVLSEPFGTEICNRGAAFVDSPEAALEVLSQAAPVEVTLYDSAVPQSSVVVVDGCRMFADYVSNTMVVCRDG